jgi:hypothetical protein
MSNPRKDEDPGPPFIQIERGAFSGSLRDSKNQKKVLMEKFWGESRSERVPGGRWM